MAEGAQGEQNFLLAGQMKRRKAKVGDAYYERAQLGRLLPVPRIGKRTPVRGHARWRPLEVTAAKP